MSGYYTIWQDGDPSDTIDITGPIINGAWRIRPDGDMLLLEYCSGGKYVDFAIGWTEGMNPIGNWQFVISNNVGTNNVLSIVNPSGDTVISWTSFMGDVVEWRFNVACNSFFAPEAILNDDSVDTGFFAYEPGSFTTSLSDLLTCPDYTTKPVSDYLGSLCCLKDHYKVTRQYLEAQGNVAGSCGNQTLMRWTRTVAISEINCALELLENLEAQLNMDADNNATEASQGTQEAVLDFFNYLVSAKALVVLNSDLQRITSLDNAGCFSTYGILRYSNNCCRRKPFYLRPCFVETTNNQPV